MLTTIFASFLILVRVEVFFSATDGCKDKIINAIESAEKSIKVAVYSFTSREISEALIRKSHSVDIRVITDGEQAQSKFSKHSFLIKNGVRVKIADYSDTKKRFIIPKMHHKFMIIDDKFVITGSYNFTASAEEMNDENCVFIYEAPDIIKKFNNEFERLWKIAK